MTLQELMTMNGGIPATNGPPQSSTDTAGPMLANGYNAVRNLFPSFGNSAQAAPAPAPAPVPAPAPALVAAPAAPVAQPSVPLPQPRPAAANAPMSLAPPNPSPTQPPTGLYNGPGTNPAFNQNLFGQQQGGGQQQQAPQGVLPKLFSDINGIGKMFGSGASGSLAPAGFGMGGSAGALF